MKTKTLIILLSIITFVANGQEYKKDTKSITGVFEATGKTKSEIFASIYKWISINYNSAQSVIQMNDLESGTIVVKGINEIIFENPMKQMYPNNAYVAGNIRTRFNHTIEINVKDDKYRIIYTVTDMISESNPPDKDDGLFFNCFNLVAVDDSNVKIYYLAIEPNLKAGFMSEKKRIEYYPLINKMFQTASAKLEYSIKSTLMDIEKSVNKQEETW